MSKNLSSSAQQRPSIVRAGSIRRPSEASGPVDVHAGGESLLSKFTGAAKHVFFQTEQIAQKTVKVAGGVVASTADAVGLKGQVLAAETIARKFATQGTNQTKRAVNKARRMANRAFDFDEDSGNSYDYDLLLSAAGAIEKSVAVLATHSQPFQLPAGSALIWKARVKKFDIGFSVKETVEESGQPPVVLEAPQKYSMEMPIQGRIAPEPYNRTVTLHFDNSFSALQSKTVVFWVAIGENVSLSDDMVGVARSKEVSAADDGPQF
jgi:hypothetical protein